MSVILTIIVTVLIFSVLITIHEAGHYFVARLCGVGIREFSIGMGPKIHTWQLKHNKFSIRWLPIGGYVAMVGEDPNEVADELPPEDRGKVGLDTKPLWQRALVVLAGPFMNIFLAFVIMAVIVMASGSGNSTTIKGFYVGDDCENSYHSYDKVGDGKEYSSICGLLPGDEIVEIDGTPVHVFGDVNYLVALRGKEALSVVVLRDGKKVETTVDFPESVSNGIAMGALFFDFEKYEKNFGEVMHQSFWQPVSVIKMTVESLFRAIRGEYGWKAVSGPVGVGEQIGEVIEQSESFIDRLYNLSMMLVLISVSLGVCNLLPIPVLDGGHLLLYIIEAIRRKPISKKTEAGINAFFTVLLFGFMIFVALKDVIGLF